MFVTAQELDPQLLGLRSLNKLKSAHGGLYMGIHYNNDKLYLVLGTRDKPIATPKGITINDDPKGAWASMSVACDDSILPAIDGKDNKIRQLLADNSEGLFGMKCTPEMIAKYKFCTPLAYSKEESSLEPLAGGKVTTTTIAEDQIGHSMMNNPTVLANLSEAIPAGSKVRMILSLGSSYFSAKTKCKLSVKVERIQLIEAGSDVVEVENNSFAD
ncbi:TPA: hypothetical protein ACH3X3_000113 [Trebouxia sp. C0006]